MPVVFDALAVQLCFDFRVYRMRLLQKFLPGAHAGPLEGRERLRHKEGGADGNLAFSVPLIFGIS